ncbi:MAG: tRNA (adenosine(37)-N6)-dimethylallyltransferase MiaA [Candidatus Izemoplasmatales bacterium]
MMCDLIMIVGPTAVGKTNLSIELAKVFDGEIINADAMQFYKGLNIGTAKIKEDQKQDIVHHLLDFLNPEEAFSVVEYQKLVREKVEEIKRKKKCPIIVGGSGLYLSSIIDDYKFFGKERDSVLNEKYLDFSTEELAKMLLDTKPLLAKKCDLSNRRRVLRALEKNDSDVQKELKPFYDNAVIIGLETERNLLYKRIDCRVDEMINSGLEKEVKSLYDRNIVGQSVQAIGYKEFYEYFEGNYSKEKTIELIKRNSRRYAKRQMTWFKNKMNVTWFNVNFDNFSNTIEEITKYIKKIS